MWGSWGSAPTDRGRTARALVAALLITGLASGCSASVPAATTQPPATATGTATATDTDPQGSSTPATSEPTAAAPGGDATKSGLVTHIVDGDTLDVAGVGRIRVIGIDTPERGDCGYDSATLAMAALVSGRTVSLTPGAADDADRYGRLLRYVDVGSIDAGLSLLRDGWAIARYDSRDGYGRHPRQDEYIAADAQSPDLGCYPDYEP